MPMAALIMQMLQACSDRHAQAIAGARTRTWVHLLGMHLLGWCQVTAAVQAGCRQGAGATSF